MGQALKSLSDQIYYYSLPEFIAVAVIVLIMVFVFILVSRKFYRHHSLKAIKKGLMDKGLDRGTLQQKKGAVTPQGFFQKEFITIRDMINDEDPHVRAMGVEVLEEDLVKLRANARTALDLMIPLLKDQNNQVRANLARAIYRYDPVQAKKIINEMVHSENLLMQLSGAWVCGQIKDEQSIDLLNALALTKNTLLKKRILKSLARIKQGLNDPAFANTKGVLGVQLEVLKKKIMKHASWDLEASKVEDEQDVEEREVLTGSAAPNGLGESAVAPDVPEGDIYIAAGPDEPSPAGRPADLIDQLKRMMDEDLVRENRRVVALREDLDALEYLVNAESTTEEIDKKVRNINVMLRSGELSIKEKYEETNKRRKSTLLELEELDKKTDAIGFPAGLEDQRKLEKEKECTQALLNIEDQIMTINDAFKDLVSLRDKMERIMELYRNKKIDRQRQSFAG